MKKVIIGVVFVVALALISWFMYSNEQKSTIKGELTDFAIEDTAAIDQIIMKDDAGQSVKLDRTEKGWILNDQYPARKDGMNILLYTMKRVRVKSPISQQSMQSILKNIIASHVLVEAYSDGELIKSYYVGGANPSHTGTNMLMKGSERPFATHIEGFHGYLTPRYFTNENEWRHRGLFEYNPENIQELSIAYHASPSNNFKITRNQPGDTPEVYYGEDFGKKSSEIDTLMLNGYLKNYQMIHWESFEETKTEAYIDSVKQSEPYYTFTLKTFDGENRLVHGYQKPLPGGFDVEGNPTDIDVDRLYLWADSSTFVVGQYAIFDKLTKGIIFFRRG